MQHFIGRCGCIFKVVIWGIPKVNDHLRVQGTGFNGFQSDARLRYFLKLGFAYTGNHCKLGQVCELKWQ